MTAIEEASFVLHWDVIGHEPDCETVIHHGDRIIAREPAVVEGVHRSRRVAELLRRRHGKALQDLIPTEASQLYLWEDDLRNLWKTPPLGRRGRKAPSRRKSTAGWPNGFPELP